MYSHLSVPADRRITLEHLRAFVTVAESGSFHSAGTHLKRSQPTITQHIKKLENLLNCQLLDRSQGHVSGLTPDGERILPEVKEILHRLDNLVNVLLRPELKGHISLGVTPSIRNAELQVAISGCMAMNKGLRVQLTTAMSITLEEMVEQGLLDIAIVSQTIRSDADGSRLLKDVIREEPLVWVSDKHMRYDKNDEIPLVTFSEGSPWREASIEALEKAKMRYYYAYVSASFESICSAITAGFGVTAVPYSNVIEKHVILDPADGLPELPRVRAAILMKTDSGVVRQFRDLLKQLPVFSKNKGITKGNNGQNVV